MCYGFMDLLIPGIKSVTEKQGCRLSLEVSTLFIYKGDECKKLDHDKIINLAKNDEYKKITDYIKHECRVLTQQHDNKLLSSEKWTIGKDGKKIERQFTKWIE